MAMAHRRKVDWRIPLLRNLARQHCGVLRIREKTMLYLDDHKRKKQLHKRIAIKAIDLHWRLGNFIYFARMGIKFRSAWALAWKVLK